MAKAKPVILRDRKRFEVLTKEELISSIAVLRRRLQYLEFLLAQK